MMRILLNLIYFSGFGTSCSVSWAAPRIRCLDLCSSSSTLYSQWPPCPSSFCGTWNEKQQLRLISSYPINSGSGSWPCLHSRSVLFEWIQLIGKHKEWCHNQPSLSFTVEDTLSLPGIYSSWEEGIYSLNLKIGLFVASDYLSIYPRYFWNRYLHFEKLYSYLLRKGFHSWLKMTFRTLIIDSIVFEHPLIVRASFLWQFSIMWRIQCHVWWWLYFYYFDC